MLNQADYQPQILIIDDDQELGEMLKEYLEALNYQVQLAFDGEQGLAKATGEQRIDLILLDVMMPRLDGFEVLRRLRVSHATPVLMLTARGEDIDRILGLEMGADDYLAKPFNHRELAARIKAIMRRLDLGGNSLSAQDLSVNGVTLSMRQHTVHCREQLVELTATEFSMLRLLMTNAGQLVSKEHISEKVLGRPLAAFDRSIDMHMSNLRRKLAAASSAEKIKTVRGAGYLFVQCD